MKLVDLNPKWISSGGEGVFSSKDHSPVPLREGTFISFDCPCGKHDIGPLSEEHEKRIHIPIDPPLSGGESVHPRAWKRIGDTFESLTLEPSIQRIGGCAWHGWVRNGETITA